MNTSLVLCACLTPLMEDPDLRIIARYKFVMAQHYMFKTQPKVPVIKELTDIQLSWLEHLPDEEKVNGSSPLMSTKSIKLRGGRLSSPPEDAHRNDNGSIAELITCGRKYVINIKPLGQ